MSAKATIVTANGTISPKVFWPLVVSIILTFVATFLSAITPEMLGALGPLAFPMGLALGAVSQVIVAYMKGDELRDLGVQATAAIIPSYKTDDEVTPQGIFVDPGEFYEPDEVEEPEINQPESEDVKSDEFSEGNDQLLAEVNQVRNQG